MIDRGDIRQAIDRCSNIWASPGMVMVSSNIVTTTVAKFKEAGGTVREVDVWAESPRLSPLWLSASSSACHGRNHYRDNAIAYKASATRNARELKLANAAITDMQMRQRDVAARCKIHEELADAKAENDIWADVAAGVVGCTSKRSVSQCVSHHRLRRG